MRVLSELGRPCLISSSAWRARKYAALLPARAQPAAGVDDHVAQFGPVLEIPAKHLALDDDAPADAGAQRVHDQVVDVLAGARPELAPGGGVGVVLQRGPDSRLLFHDLAEGHVLHARQVARIDHQALAMAHGSGRADPDADDLFVVDAGLGDGLLGGVDDVRDHLVAALVHFRQRAQLRFDVAFAVQQPGRDVRATQIDSNAITARHL
jgi:hypothetical protein